MSAEKALNKFLANHEKKRQREQFGRRKNKKPEFEFRKSAVKWLESMGFSVDVVEARFVYSEQSGGYHHGQTEPGFSDLVCVCPYFGVAGFIELKAPGNRYAIRANQHDFLTEKIEMGAFCICADSVEYIQQTFQEWLLLRRGKGYEASIEFLKSELPKRPLTDDNLDDIL